jgi:glycosyltransferase involved in cell wall biosynthesis
MNVELRDTHIRCRPGADPPMLDNALRPTRVLLISGFRIFPCQTGGHLRSGGIARALARMGYSVRIYSLGGRNSDYRDRSVRAQGFRFDAIEPGLDEETHLGLGFGVLQAIGRRLNIPRVWQYYLMKVGLIPKRLRNAIAASDVVLSDMPWCAKISGKWHTRQWFLMSHNLEHRLLAQGGWIARCFAGWMRGIERRAAACYVDIFACAEEDQAFYKGSDSTGRLAVPIIGCGVDPNAYQVPQGTRSEVRSSLGLSEDDTALVFSGSKWGPNQDALEALRAFCREHARYLLERRVYVLILGSILDHPVREGALIGTGRVPETIPYFAASDAGLNPVTSGSGANVKLFEYLAARLPVISTGFGVRGSGLERDRDFLHFEMPALRNAIETFLTRRTRPQWREFAEDVWMRHRNICDITELVRDSVNAVPAFPAARTQSGQAVAELPFRRSDACI